MKQFSARLLVFLCIISFAPMKEVIKAPLVVVHYVEHLQQHPQMTLQQFYFMHYTVDIHFDEDYEHDRQLPFKTCDFSPITPFIVGSFFKNIDTLGIQCDFEQHVLNQTDTFWVKNLNEIGIFHPPQSA